MLGMLALAPAYGGGLLSISNTVITLAPEGRQTVISVSNKGDQPLYLDVIQQQVLNPGHLPEQRVLVQDVPEPDLLIPVKHVILRPGQTRSIPVSVIAMPKYTNVWRVAFRQREVVSAAGDSASFVKLNVSYGVAIYHKGTATGQGE